MTPKSQIFNKLYKFRISSWSLILGIFTLLAFFPQLSYSQNTSSGKYGGQLVRSTTSDPKSFNDIMAKETSTTEVTNMIFEGLTTVNAYTTKVDPQLAESWEVSEDGLEWIFRLRQDVLWHDGVPFTADDVAFTFNELIFNDDIPSSARDIYTIDGKQFKVEVLDRFTVKFILPVKFAPFLMSMNQSILPKHKLEKIVKEGKFNFSWGIDTDPREIVGTGPFQFVEYSPSKRLVFDRNPNYWKKSADGEALPFLDRVLFIIVPSLDIQLLKFMEGSVDAYGLRGTDYPYIKPEEKKGNFTIYDLGPATGSNFITFNLNPGKNPKTEEPFVDPIKLKWFQNVKFRQAVAHAIDKDKIVEIVKNRLGYHQNSPIGPGAGFFHNPDVPKYEYDLDKAKEILASEGFKDRDDDGFIEDQDGNVIEFNLNTNAGNTEREDIAGIIRGDLERLGMKVNFMGLEFNTLVSKLNGTLEWEAIILGLTGGVEPHFGKNVWHSTGTLHLWHPQQAEPMSDWERRIDEIFTEGVQQLDEGVRKIYYDEFQVIVSENLPVIYTVLSAKNTAVRNKFGNLNPTNYGGVYHNLEELYVLPEYRH